jgi:hypothetical protein
MNHSTIKAQIYTSASWYSAESILFLVAGGYEGTHQGKTYLHLLQWGKSQALKIYSRYHWAQKVQIYWQGDLMGIKKSNFACVYMRDISQYDSGERCSPWASCFNIDHRSLVFVILPYISPCLHLLLPLVSWSKLYTQLFFLSVATVLFLIVLDLPLSLSVCVCVF